MREQEEPAKPPPRFFSSRIFTMLVAVEIVLVAAAMILHADGDLAATASPSRRSRWTLLRSANGLKPHHVSPHLLYGIAGDSLRRHPQHAWICRLTCGGKVLLKNLLDDDGVDAGGRVYFRLLATRLA